MKVSNCCCAPVRDLAGDGVGGLDICPDCKEWCAIEALEEDLIEEGEEENE